MRVHTRLAVAVAAAAAALAGSGWGPISAHAYGSADHPLAQLELSANCNNPSFSLCQHFGLGGIWLWIEVDADGTGDESGADCGHDRAGSGGAGSTKMEIHWAYASASQLPAGAFVAGQDPGGQYYLIEEFGIAFPVTQGHYAFHPVPGVAIETQVAP